MAKRRDARIEALDARVLLSAISFRPPVSYATGGYSQSPVIADLGNGHPDIITAKSDGTIGILLGNGDGTFQPQFSYPVGGDSTDLPSFAVADLGNGHPDLIITDSKSTSVGVLLGNGDGTFGAIKSYAVGNAYGGPLVLDLGNGHPDAIVSHPDGTVSVLIGNGDGTFKPQKTLAGVSVGLLTLANLGNGHPDIIGSASTPNGAGIAILMGNGDGTFQPDQSIYTGGSADSIVVADVGNGHPDLVVSNSSSELAVLLGKGNGTFSYPTYEPIDGGPPVVVADLGNGHPDIIGWGGFVLLGNGDGTFQPRQNLFNSDEGDVLIADLGNGHLDVIGFNDSGVDVLINHPAAHDYAFTQGPGNTSTGAIINPAIRVSAEDSNGNVLVSASGSVTLALSTTQDAGVLHGTLTQPLVNGVATFNDVAILNTGVYSLVASDASGVGAVSASFIVSWVPNASLSPPVVLAAFNGPIGSRVVLDAKGDLFGTNSGSGNDPGSVFEISAGNGVVETLAKFGTDVGDYPADLAIDSAGNLFGDNQRGIWELSKNSHTIQLIQPLVGIVFSSLAVDNADDVFGEILVKGTYTAGDYTIDYRYSAAAGFSEFDYQDGPTPFPHVSGGLSCDTAGDEFVPLAGLYNGSSVSYLQVPGAQVNFNGTSATGGSYVQGTAADNKGNVYAITDGVDGNPGLVEYNLAARRLTVLGYLDGLTQGTRWGGGPIVDSAGDVFAVTSNSGDFGYGSLVELPAGQSTFKTLMSFNTPDGYQQAAGLTTDANGNLFGTLPNGTGTAVFEWPAVGSNPNPITPTTDATIGLRPVIVHSTIPTSLVGGIHFKGAVRVRLTPLSQGAASGILTTKLYAESNSASILIGQFSQRYRKGIRALAATFRVSTILPVSSYTIIAQSTDSAGNIVAGPTGPVLNVVAPFTHVTATVLAITPRIHPGRTGVVTLVLTNTGNVPARDPITISIGVTNSFSLLNQMIQLPVYGKRRVRLRFAVPATAAGGFYDPVVTTTVDEVTTTITSARLFRVY